MLVRDLMTRDPALVVSTDTVAVAADLMRVRGVGMLPVVDHLVHRKLEGVLTDRDLVVRHLALDHGSRAKVHEHMTRDMIIAALPTDSLEQTAERMRAHKVRRVPVIDDAGSVVGVIGLADLARYWADRAPEQLAELTAGIVEPGALVL